MIQRVGFRHLQRLTDNVGLLEHAHYLIPRREEGYTTDDNARALWCVLWWLPLLPPGPLAERLENLADTYLAFLRWNQLEDGTFYNNIDYARRREPEEPSDDCFGRTLWALSYAVSHAPNANFRQLALDLLDKALPNVQRLRAPRGMAYALAACVQLARANRTALRPTMEATGTPRWPAVPAAAAREPDVGEQDVISELAGRLAALYEKSAEAGWRWYEPVMTYSNGLLPWAMLAAGDWLRHERFIQIGIESLDFLIAIMQHSSEGFIEPVGNRQWCTKTARSVWDQQPVDVFKLALALHEAQRITGNKQYGRLLVRCRQWFYGDNRLQAMMCLPDEGAGLDGLNENGPSMNAGAESTLAFLMTERLFLEHMGRSPEGHAYHIDVDDNTLNIRYLARLSTR